MMISYSYIFFSNIITLLFVLQFIIHEICSIKQTEKSCNISIYTSSLELLLINWSIFPITFQLHIHRPPTNFPNELSQVWMFIISLGPQLPTLIRQLLGHKLSLLRVEWSRDPKIAHYSIYYDSNLLAPVFYFTETVKTSLWAVWAEQQVQYT